MSAFPPQHTPHLGEEIPGTRDMTDRREDAGPKEELASI